MRKMVIERGAARSMSSDLTRRVEPAPQVSSRVASASRRDEATPFPRNHSHREWAGFAGDLSTKRMLDLKE